MTDATTALRNVAIGRETLANLTIGHDNIAIGQQAIQTATEGLYNVGVGYYALQALTTGDYNMAYGNEAGVVITEGVQNVLMGGFAGREITTGDNNICLGYNTGRTGTPGGEITTGDNTLRIGNQHIANSHVQVDWTVASDKRDKTDVKPAKMGLDFVNKLEPVTYHWDKRTKYTSLDDLESGKTSLSNVVHDGTHKEDWTDIGFLAQDVEKLENEYGHKLEDKSNLTFKRSDDDAYGLTYAKFVPILTKAIQELSTKNDSLETSNQALIARIEALENA